MTTNQGAVPLEVAGRLDRLRDRFETCGLDALIVTNLANVRYLSGFSGSAGVVVVTGKGALLTTDGRYRTQSVEQVAAAGAEVEVVVGGVQAQRQAVKDVLASSGRVGLEADDVTWAASRR